MGIGRKLCVWFEKKMLIVCGIIGFRDICIFNFDFFGKGSKKDLWKSYFLLSGYMFCLDLEGRIEK